MAQDKVQLKREEVVGSDVVLQDINPKTKTNSITDSTKGVPLDQVLAMIKNMINNKLSRNVNSVNGRTGVVVLDASDVGLSNVDNVSFGDIKRWVIEYMEDIFDTKHLILKEYLTEIHTIIGTNDKAYADTPFYCEKGDSQSGDYMAYIGYIWWDDEHQSLQETHLQIRVVGYTDRSLIYNTNVGDRHFSNGGLAVNIWKGEDALKVMNNVISQTGYSAEELGESGLYIDKPKIVPDVYFFDGIYGTLDVDGEVMHNHDALVYWSTDPHDGTVGNLPIIQIFVNGVEVSKSAQTGGTVETLHTQQNFKVGDIIISNFAYDAYIDPDSSDGYMDKTYPKILDSLTCRQPGIGRVMQAADTTTNTPCIVEFHTLKPNVGRGLKLSDTNDSSGSPSDTAVELDILSMKRAKMNDDTGIYDGTPYDINISGINAFNKYELAGRYSDPATERKIYTVYPTGSSNNVLSEMEGHINSNSMFILPNFSLCVIPGYPFTHLNSSSSTAGVLSNWDSSSTIDDPSSFGPLIKEELSWNMLGINLEKMTWGGNNPDVNTHRYARNISGLRVNTDVSTLSEIWFGFSDQDTSAGIASHSGGLSVNVGDFLSIGSQEEISNTTAIEKEHYYEEGKVNVRINKLKGLHSSGENRLAVNIAEGYIYQPTSVGANTSTWLEGGLKFIPDNDRTPGQGPLAVNTGMGSSGLGVKNNYLVGTKGIYYGYRTENIREDNVLVVQPYSLSTTILKNVSENGVKIDEGVLDVKVNILEEDIVSKLPIRYPSNKIWDSFGDMYREYETGTYTFNEFTIYIAGGKRYVFYYEGGSQGRFADFIVYYSDETEYDVVMQSITNGVIDSSITWPLDIDLLRLQCHVLVTPKDPTTNPDEYNVRVSIYQPGTSDLRVPDINHDGVVDAADSSIILSICVEAQSSIEIYTNADETEFFTDEELTTHVVPEEGKNYYTINFYQEIPNYRDPSGPPYKYYMRYIGAKNASGNVIIKRRPVANWGKSNEILMSFDDLVNADVDRDGYVDSSDAAMVLSFYAEVMTGSWSGYPVEEQWREFLREKLGINVEPGNGSVNTILEYTFTKGTRVRYNELMGLTSNIEAYTDSETITPGMILGNATHNALSIKIADKSSGFEAYDSTRFGGLRFGTEGYLGVRVNTNNNFSAWNPIKNNILNRDDMSQGSRGLRIYEDNVVGIQLTTDGKRDNGELKIDEYGCLKLSDAIRPNTENLTISGKDASGNDKSVSYNGRDEIIIELGDGLIFEE
jgi:hypothetical protein